MIKNKSEIIDHINKSIDNSSKNISKLSEEILSLYGYSGIQTRHLYNNLCSIEENINYLEIGTYRGSTLISSCYKNKINSIAIDDWSQFDGSYEILVKNLNMYDIKNVKIIQKNCFTVDETDIEKNSIDIYLYDGHHSYESQFNAINYFYDFLSPLSIIIIDDFCWPNVSTGTLDAFEHIKDKLSLVEEWKIESGQDTGGDKTYWNGCGIFLCERISNV